MDGVREIGAGEIEKNAYRDYSGMENNAVEAGWAEVRFEKKNPSPRMERKINFKNSNQFLKMSFFFSTTENRTRVTRVSERMS